MSNENPDCVVARCGCKRLVFAAVNEPLVMDHAMYVEITKLIRGGCSIEHMSVEVVRKSDFGCRCKP